jgi:streptogrisin C
MHLKAIRLSRRRTGAALAFAVFVAASIAAGGTAQAGPDPNGPAAVAERAAQGDAAVVAAMQRDLGLTAAQAKQRMADQTKALKVDRDLRTRLGSGYNGSWFDASTGRLVADVTSQTDAGTAAAAGAQARVVKHSLASLQNIKTDLDVLSGRTRGSNVRAVQGNRQPAVAGLTGWYVDTKTNTVVVTAVKGKPTTAAMQNLAKYGDAIRMEYLASAPTQTYNFMDGGDLLAFDNGAGCSNGFDLRNPSTGQQFILTAGHCAVGATSVWGQGGVFFGTVVADFFPTFDDSLIRNDNPGYWIEGPWVDLNPSNGGVIIINGFTDAPVGTTVCKSGITTGLTCGVILAKAETVTFDGVNTVYDETRNSSCVQKGDSGGSNFAIGSTYTAEGVTSGAVLYGPSLLCGAKVGQPTISWYFPIANSLSYYTPAYGVTLF